MKRSHSSLETVELVKEVENTQPSTSVEVSKNQKLVKKPTVEEAIHYVEDTPYNTSSTHKQKSTEELMSQMMEKVSNEIKEIKQILNEMQHTLKSVVAVLMPTQTGNDSPIDAEKNQAICSDGIEQAENTDLVFEYHTYPLETVEALYAVETLLAVDAKYFSDLVNSNLFKSLPHSTFKLYTTMILKRLFSNELAIQFTINGNLDFHATVLRCFDSLRLYYVIKGMCHPF
ncbi:uncharacterized protein LOC130698265 [Daphnia carinata]|uniref:uncharacterized protein LOC130698265 n=1 Tax=Daphnia carinata TaxID=120202 RepID=UPI0028691D7D|nr:uncharacterized protein LOC130698265 [Daphnia carinata]